MIKTGRKILFFILMLFLGINLSCERIEPDDYTGTGEELVSLLNPDVKLLDQNEFTYLGVVEGKHIFEVQNGADIPSIGGIFFYFDDEEQVFGKIESLSGEVGLISLDISPVSLNEVFDFMALKIALNELDSDSTFLDPRVSLSSDTMVLEPIEKLWDLDEGNWGLLNLDTLKIINKPDGNEQYYMGPVWEEGKAVKKIEMELEHEFDLQARIRIFSSGNYTITDSILIRERRLGPFYADNFPLDYLIQEWLLISVNSEGDNRFEAGFTASGTCKLEAVYLAGKGWEVSSGTSRLEDEVKEIVWNKKDAVNISISFETRFIPAFCRDTDIEFKSINTWNFESNVKWPDWDYSVNRDFGHILESGNELFSYLPEEKYSDSDPSRLIMESSGQLANNPPVPFFSIEPSSGFTDTNFSFNAGNSYDQEDDVSQMEVRWDFNGNEVWDTNFSKVKTASHIFTTPGNYTVIMEVKDSQGLTARLPKSVNVQAVSSAPTAHFIVSPESGRISDAFTFDASGCWDSEDDVSELKVRWDFDGDDSWDTQFSKVKTASHFFTEPNTYVAKLEVKDTQGLTGSTSKIIEVDAINIKPTAFFTRSHEVGEINTLFTFDASGSSDVEDETDLLMVRWDFENDGTWDTEYRTIKTVSKRYLTANSYTVLLEVIDTDGYLNTYSADILVINPNTPPKADFTIIPVTGDTTTLFSFDASITEDLEDTLGELKFRWDWDNEDPFDTEYSSSPVIERTFDEPGIYIIKVQVIDSGGLTHTKARLLTIE